MKVKYFLVGIAICIYILYKRLIIKKPNESIKKDVKKLKKII